MADAANKVTAAAKGAANRTLRVFMGVIIPFVDDELDPIIKFANAP